MPLYRTPTADPTKILKRSELALVLADLQQRATRSANGRRNLVLFRLAVYCGLRVSEIAPLTITDDARAELHVRGIRPAGRRLPVSGPHPLVLDRV
jgi:integrase